MENFHDAEHHSKKCIRSCSDMSTSSCLQKGLIFAKGNKKNTLIFYFIFLLFGWNNKVTSSFIISGLAEAFFFFFFIRVAIGISILAKNVSPTTSAVLPIANFWAGLTKCFCLTHELAHKHLLQGPGCPSWTAYLWSWCFYETWHSVFNTSLKNWSRDTSRQPKTKYSNKAGGAFWSRNSMKKTWLLCKKSQSFLLSSINLATHPVFSFF